MVDTNQFPELQSYDKDGCFEIVHEGTADQEQGTYEIIFNVDNQRYYCITAAHSMLEALGLFSQHHPHVNYDMVEEHMEL